MVEPLYRLITEENDHRRPITGTTKDPLSLRRQLHTLRAWGIPAEIERTTDRHLYRRRLLPPANGHTFEYPTLPDEDNPQPPPASSRVTPARPRLPTTTLPLPARLPLTTSQVDPQPSRSDFIQAVTPMEA